MGKWRNNGEALEPKWRDGDTVPLLPFSQFSRFSRDKIDNSEEEDDYDRRAAKYRQNNRRGTFLRSRNSPRLPYSDYEDRELTESRRGYREREEILPRKRNRPWTGENVATFKETRKEDLDRGLEEHKEITSARYREIFQARPNDYEHEFNDEEYLKPRPRKRRPPQNYEFALVENEMLQEGRTENNSGAWSRVNGEENAAEVASKGVALSQNAMELKSLLKMQQEEGLSLSEILQQRNLTLDDLLKGKADVINALKMRDVDESEDYEESAKMMTNSFVKLSTTGKPQWTLATEPVKTKNSQKDEEVVISMIPTTIESPKNRTNARAFSDKVNNGETYSEVGNATAGKSFLANVDPPRVKITTSMPLPVATNSMELLQADDATVKSSGSGEIRAESLDEDEIMEFSDFTDYKKGRSGVSPVWLMMKDENVSGPTELETSKSHLEDRGSTLSIEKILSPTERSKSTNNLSMNTGNQEQLLGDSTNINRSGIPNDEDQRGEAMDHFEEDYNASSEKEYQSDTPVIYYDLEQSTQISNFTDENDRTIMQELESALDAMSRDINSTLENSRQSLSKNPAAKNDDNNSLKNHRDRNATEKKSYDDIVSEVEPEARAEIFELFASGSAGKRLERLLKSRNMSLEELIALRQRGSSKVHLAQVSRIRAHKPNDEYRIKDTDNLKATNSLSPKEDLHEGRAIVNHDNYDREVGNYLSGSTENSRSIDSLSNSMDLVHPEEFTTERSMPNVEPKTDSEDAKLVDASKMNNENEDKERQHTVQIVDLLTTFDSFPFMKDIQREFSGNEDKRKLLVQESDVGVMFINNDAETIRVNDTSNIVESGFVKEIVKQEPSSINVQTVYSKTSNILGEDENKSEKGKTLSKVKPSIIASGAILGVTLVVFLAIFIVCRIRQKQKYRYSNTFSRAVFQGPVMAARKLSNSSSLSTVMVNVVATSTARRPEKNENQEPTGEMDPKSDIDNDSLDANDSWETIPDYMK